MEKLFGGTLQRCEFINAGIVYEDVEFPVGFLGFGVMSACFETSPCTAMALPPLAVISCTTRSAYA
jgi:hypothetical protein